MTDELTISLIKIAGILLIVSLIGFQIYASYQCGWGNTLLYGKNVGWAYITGYCEAK